MQFFGVGIFRLFLVARVLAQMRPRAFGLDPDQPVPELLSGDAVDAVVVPDLVEDLLLALLAPAFVSDHRAARRRHLTFALSVIEGFHRLDGIVRLRADQSAAHNGLEIDEPALAQEPV